MPKTKLGKDLSRILESAERIALETQKLLQSVQALKEGREDKQSPSKSDK